MTPRQLVSIKDWPTQAKIQLLRELGYGSDGRFVLEASGRKVRDPYTEEPVTLDRMLILPGSTIIIDNNPLSLAGYFEEYGETF